MELRPSTDASLLEAVFTEWGAAAQAVRCALALHVLPGAELAGPSGAAAQAAATARPPPSSAAAWHPERLFGMSVCWDLHSTVYYLELSGGNIRVLAAMSPSDPAVRLPLDTALRYRWLCCLLPAFGFACRPALLPPAARRVGVAAWQHGAGRRERPAAPHLTESGVLLRGEDAGGADETG